MSQFQGRHTKKKNLSVWPFLVDSLLSQEDVCMLQGSAQFHIYLFIKVLCKMIQGFSPGNLNYVILSLKITSSSAVLILLPYAFLFMVLGVILCFISPVFSQIWSRALLRVLSLQGGNFGTLSLKWRKSTDLLPQGGKRLLGGKIKVTFDKFARVLAFLWLLK